jgi:hypothetical protein
MAAIAVPDRMDRRDFLRRLSADERVVSGVPMGTIHGAGRLNDPDRRASESQWHLIASRAPLAGDSDVSDYVVAVLDTGVAYEDHDVYVQAPSLSGIRWVAPYDFVNRDEHPNDDHQHGTHIASIIASEGDVEGVAPGVSIMPLKVLDEDNAGTEIDLIDAIDWAVEHGADVINMSLAFPPGYIPSLELQQALHDAADAGVVLIGAAGNDSADMINWPAASRAVIAVASARPGSWDAEDGDTWDGKSAHLADYSNRGLDVDITAPGGTLTTDHTGDGVLDGIMAETIHPDDPATTGGWLYAGTSQAAAVVSGAAIHLLHAGAAPDQVALALQYKAFSKGFEQDPLMDGSGAGALNLKKALKGIEQQEESLEGGMQTFASVLPYIHEKNNKFKAKARLSIVDQDGNPIEEGEVFAVVWDGEPTFYSCDLDEDGTCTIKTEKYSVDDSEAPQAFAIQVSGVLIDDIMHRPGKAVFGTDGGEIVLSAIADTEELDDSMLAFWFSGEEDEHLKNVSESYVVLDMGTGLSSSPMGVVFRPDALEDADITNVSVDLDGTGLSSSPLGLTSVRRLDIDGTGLSSSPLGFRTLSLAAIDGTGLSSSPLGFHPVHMTSPSAGTGLSSSPLGLKGEPILLSIGKAIGTNVEEMALETLITGSGIRTEDGYEAASLLTASDALSVGIAATGTAGAGSSDAISLDEATE